MLRVWLAIAYLAFAWVEIRLDARRTAAQAVSKPQVVAAFDSRRLGALVDTAVREFAAARFATQAPARRALEAELFELIEPLRDGLTVLVGSGSDRSLWQMMNGSPVSWAMANGVLETGEQLCTAVTASRLVHTRRGDARLSMLAA